MEQLYMKTAAVFDTTLLTVGDAYTIYRYTETYNANGQVVRKREQFNGLLVEARATFLMFMIFDKTCKEPATHGFPLHIDEVLNGKIRFVHLGEEKNTGVDGGRVEVIPSRYDLKNLIKGRSYQITDFDGTDRVGILEQVSANELVFKTDDLISPNIRIDSTLVFNEEVTIHLLPADQTDTT